TCQETPMTDGTLKVTPITDRQPAPSAKFTITASIDGFPITIEGEGRAGDLRLIIDRLKSIGAEPPAQGKCPEPVNAQGKCPERSEPTSKSAPLCPVHNKPMKASQKPGAFYCPRRNDDGAYCRETA